jgi:hypothetical protein
MLNASPRAIGEKNTSALNASILLLDPEKVCRFVSVELVTPAVTGPLLCKAGLRGVARASPLEF